MASLPFHNSLVIRFSKKIVGAQHVDTPLRVMPVQELLCNFTINRDGGIGADQCANSTPRASVLERVRGVVALRGKPRHVQFHHFLWTCAEANSQPLQ